MDVAVRQVRTLAGWVDRKSPPHRNGAADGLRPRGDIVTVPTAKMGWMDEQTPVESALREIERHVTDAGWDQPTRLFALVSSADLMAKEPSLAAELGSTDTVPDLTSVEQDGLPPHRDLTDLLTGMTWPSTVLGIAVVAERIVLPNDADDELPTDPDEARQLAARDPRRHELRVAAAAMRDGSGYSLLRLRDHDDDAALLAGPQLISGLSGLLSASLLD